MARKWSVFSAHYRRCLPTGFISIRSTPLIVRPLEGLALIAALFDRYVIDGTVDAIAAIPVALGGIVRRSQSGLLQRYALAGVMGVLAMVVLLAWQLRS